MKRTGIINRDVAAAVAAMGHTDLLTICDGGFPCPMEIRCIDLAVAPNQPRFLDVLDMVLGELAVEKVFVAREMEQANPTVLAGIRQRLPGVLIEAVPHVEFKQIARRARATVRSGEFTPYANVILQSGVIY